MYYRQQKSCFYNIIFSNKIWNLQETKWMTYKFKARSSNVIQTRSSSMKLEPVPYLHKTGHKRPVQRHLCSLRLEGRSELGWKYYASQFLKLECDSEFTWLLLITDTTKHTIIVLNELYPSMIFLWISWHLHHLPKESICHHLWNKSTPPAVFYFARKEVKEYLQLTENFSWLGISKTQNTLKNVAIKKVFQV